MPRPATPSESATGVSRRRILAKNSQIPERLIREIQRSGLGQPKFMKMFRTELGEAAAETLAMYRRELKAGRMPPLESLDLTGNPHRQS